MISLYYPYNIYRANLVKFIRFTIDNPEKKATFV